ncbi:MAG TPA: glycosyltransferase family 4 protein [Mycobacteriales bacterium]|nr:glycosyltransferase family 4 protein [Mycobacteriales bacterium]
MNGSGPPAERAVAAPADLPLDQRARVARLRIALLASACHPDRGSEPGIGWSWVRSLASLGHDVELFTRADPESNRRTIEVFAQTCGPARLRLHAVPGRPRLPHADRLVPAAMREEWRSLQQYFGWLSTVDELARTGAMTGMDVVHHVTLGSLNSGSTLADLSQPVLFGPVGGGQRCPPELRSLLGASRYGEFLRDAGWATRRLVSPRFRHTMRRADVVLVTNRDTARVAARHGARRVELMMSDGTWADTLPATPPVRDLAAPLLLWVGALRPRKAPGLALRAFRHILDDFPAARLEIVGDGALRPELERLRSELGLTRRVELIGHIPHAEVHARYLRAALLLFTSVRDSLGGQAVDAWASGLPTVSFGHQGVGDFAPPNGSALVPVCAAGQAPRRFAAAVGSILRDPARYERSCAAALEHARRQTLEARADRATALYAELLAGRR